VYYFERHLKLTMSNTTLDLVSGSIGGIAGTIVGHPFDTVKVRLQTGQCGNCAATTIAKKILKREGFRGLYRGVLPPVYSMAAVNAYLFAVEGFLSRELRLDKYGTLGGFISGSLAGVAQSCILTPVELVKTQLQVKTVNVGVSESVFARQIYQTYGMR